MQRRTHSAIEAAANTAVGFVVSYGLTFAIYPLFGWTVGHTQALGVTAIYTATSLGRSYAMRRLFNYLTQREHLGRRGNWL